jgi:hypothetical protein
MTVESYTVRIWMAGDYDDARRVVRQFCANEGACFALTRADFIYSGGEESGVMATLIHYPRFPSTPQALWAKAHRLAAEMAIALCQKSYSVEASDKTEWVQVALPAFGGSTCA